MKYLPNENLESAEVGRTLDRVLIRMLKENRGMTGASRKTRGRGAKVVPILKLRGGVAAVHRGFQDQRRHQHPMKRVTCVPTVVSATMIREAQARACNFP